MILALFAVFAVGLGPPAITVIAPAPVSAPLNARERRIAVICRSEARSGTRVIRRFCTPVEDVARREHDAQEALRAIQSRSPHP